MRTYHVVSVTKIGSNHHMGDEITAADVFGQENLDRLIANKSVQTFHETEAGDPVIIAPVVGPDPVEPEDETVTDDGTEWSKMSKANLILKATELNIDPRPDSKQGLITAIETALAN